MCPCEEGLLSRRVYLAIAALLLLAVLVWASFNVSVNFSGKAEENSAERRVAELQEARAKLPSTIDYQRLDRRFQQLASENQMVGLAVGIVEHGEITFLKGYGETVAGSGDMVTPATVFRWASVSKGVAADMIAKLAAEGKLSLFQPIATYSHSLKLPGGAEHRATVADVLSHQLGIFGHANDSKLEDGMDAAMLRMDLASLNSICAVGQCHAYQNVAYDAASEVVEKVTGEPYQKVVRERLFLPLGMKSATVTREGLYAAPSWARPHRGGKNSKPVEVTDSYYRVPAAGGVNSNVKDLAIWMRAQMGLAPSILSEEALAEVQTPRVNTPGELRRMRNYRERVNETQYGLGWRIYDYAGHKVVTHRGGVTGYRSVVMFDPVKKSGVVALWNSSTNRAGGLEFEVMDMIYQLPVQDWLKLDDGMPAEAEEEPVSDSGTGV